MSETGTLEDFKNWSNNKTIEEGYKEYMGFQNSRGNFNIREVKESIIHSTKVVNWYAHAYSSTDGIGAEVRGPHKRWFNVTEVIDSSKEHVATAYEDALYCAKAMNFMPHAINLIEELQKKLIAYEREIDKMFNAPYPGQVIQGVENLRELRNKEKNETSQAIEMANKEYKRDEV